MGGICSSKHICSSESILRRARLLSLYVNYVEEKFFAASTLRGVWGINRVRNLANSMPLHVPLTVFAFFSWGSVYTLASWSCSAFFHNLHFVVNHFIPVSHQILDKRLHNSCYIYCFAFSRGHTLVSFYYFRNTPPPIDWTYIKLFFRKRASKRLLHSAEKMFHLSSPFWSH